MRRQSRNDLDYEVKQAQRECADRIEKAQRKHHERCKEIGIYEDTYKAQVRKTNNANLAEVLAKLERIDELKAKHGLNGEGGEQ